MARRISGTRFYRRLLWLYPREFREEYGEEMTYVYRNRAADEGAVDSGWRCSATSFGPRRGSTCPC